MQLEFKITLLTLYSIIAYSNMRTFLIFPLCLVLLVDMMSIWMWIDTGYLISDEKLIIKCGPLRTSVDLNTIKSVKKIRSYDKQWALSFNRRYYC